MFEQQYDEEMTLEIRRLEGKQRAIAAGHPEWESTCIGCGCQLPAAGERCGRCSAPGEGD